MDATLTDFTEWHRVRVLRRTGRAPSENTLRTKASRLRVCCTLAGLDGVRYLPHLLSDRARVEVLLDDLTARVSPTTVRTTLQALADFGEYAKAKGLATHCALVPHDWPGPNPPKPVRVYTEEEVDLLLTSARGRGLRWWAFLETLASTGRRVGEVLALEWSWLNLTADPPHFYLPHTKNGRQAYVPLSTHLVERVWTPDNMAALKRPEHDRFARDASTHPFPWSYGCAEKRWRRHCATVGLDNRGFHCLRHTKATEWLAKGVPIQAVSALLGHASVQTTDRVYSHVTALDFARYVQ